MSTNGSVSHANEHLLHPVLGAFFYRHPMPQSTIHRPRGKIVLADKLFWRNSSNKVAWAGFSNLHPILHANARTVGELDVFAHPRLALHVLNRHVLNADGMAIREFQMVNDFLERRWSNAHFRSCLKDCIKVCHRKAEILKLRSGRYTHVHEPDWSS